MTEPQPSTERASAPEPRDLDLIHSRLETLREEISSLNRTVLALGIVAAIACLAALAGLGKASSAQGETAQVKRELRALSGRLKKLSATRAPPPRHVVPAAAPSKPPKNERSSEVALRELKRLQRLVGSAPAQQGDVEADFVEWGQGIRQYVEDTQARADEGHRRERGEELRPVFQRLLELEARLDAR